MRQLKLFVLLSLSAVIVAGQGAQEDATQWRTIDAEGHYSFRLPQKMRLRNGERCVECAWGSTYSDNRIRLHAEFSTWNEEWAEPYLQKQKEYIKEWTEIDGKRAKIQSWLGEGKAKLQYIAEVRFYDAKGNLIARMSALCKGRDEVEVAKKIFRTVDFPN